MSTLWRAFLIAAMSGGVIYAQLSASAYRVLGQPDFRQNGVNLVQGVELYQPSGLALDSRAGQTHIYIADTRNSRIMAWVDIASYQIGDSPTLVLGQPGPQYSSPLGIGVKGFNSPLGLAVEPLSGNLYVADYSNNRVVRFLSPFENRTRIEPDAVYGQPSFSNRTALPPSSSTLNLPRAVAFDPAGNLWVADSGNHRVVRFSAATLNSQIPPAADTVIGQKDFFSNSANAGGQVSGSGFDTPSGMVFDALGNLYVSDGRNSRVLKYSAPLGPSAVNPTASGVWGQSNFATRGTPLQPSSSTIGAPSGLAIDGGGNLWVSAPPDNRVLVFSTGTTLGGSAKSVLGQSDFATITANTGAFPQASPNSLSGPADVKVDQNGNVIVADTANNRVLAFAPNAKSANRVWGQSDFVSNGPNQIKPASISFPYHMAIDYSSAPFALYVSDTANNRILVWKDSVRFRNGDPADLVIGQPNLRTGLANVDTQGSPNPSRTSLASPEGIAVNASDGTLYVADAGNNRVLRYPRPVNQSGRISPDVVIGQADFVSSLSAAVNATSLNTPGGLAIGPNGDLFVADSGNNRVLEFPAGAGNNSAAVRVFGQPSMTNSVRPTQASAQTLAAPQGIAVDPAGNLYVADAAANRVLIFPNTQNAPIAGMAAAFVIGQASFGATTGGSFKAPTDVDIDSSGNIYVADNGNNRVLIYPSLVFLPLSGGTPAGVIGQQSTAGIAPNYNSPDGLATAEGLYSPIGIYIDRQDTLYVGDVGNNRVAQFLKAASVVNGASFQRSVPVAQGSLATLFGGGLTGGDPVTVSSTTWPRTAANRQLAINDDLLAPIYYIGSSQVNFQVPSNAPLGSARIAVRTADTGELVAGGSFLVSSVGPGIFTTGTGQAAAINQDLTPNSSSNPAPAGSTISLYATGQGQVSPAVIDGTAAESSPLSNTVAVPTSSGSTCLSTQPSMCVAVGTGFGDVKYSGLAPGYIGLWQINVLIPQGTAAGNVQVRVVINGTPSNTVTVAVR